MFGGCTRLAGLGCKEFANDLWSLDPSTLTWKHVATVGQIPSARMWAMGTMVGTKLVLYGGMGPEGTRINQLNDVHVLDIAAEVKNWTRVTLPVEEMPPVRILATLQPYRDRFALLFGGSGGSSGPKTKNDLWAFDIETMNWGSGPLSTGDTEARAGHAAAVRDNTLLVYGGQRFDNPDSFAYNTTAAFDFVSLKWSKVNTTLSDHSQKPGARFASSGGVIGNEWFITLGNDVRDRSVDPSDVYSLNLDKNCWNRVNNLSPDRPRARIYGAVISSAANKRLIIYGGKDLETNEIAREMWSYDLE